MKKIGLVIMLLAVSAFAETPIEPKAQITDNLKDKLDVLQVLSAMVKGNGYTCDSISAARNFFTGRGYVLTCNNYAYTYEIADKGGKWVLTVK